MKTWFRKIVRSLFGWAIIIGKTGIASLDMLEDVESMNKNFKDKLDV